jgi:putative pyruvate formate lyase activating enzyme
MEKFLEKCMLCPRQCGVDRLHGKAGRCHVGAQLRVARAALHMWEEPCISGQEGSGAVFFSGCSLGCIYCQNREISGGKCGTDITIGRLSEIFLELQAQKANNINLVTAGHYVPQVASALEQAKQQGLQIPVVYNSSGYEKAETLKMLEGLVDIYLPDFKYLDPELAGKYSGAKDYPEVAKAALREMVRQRPRPQFDERGIMTAGVVVRHLLLPGHVKEAKRVIEYLHCAYGDQIYISMMNQYTPGPVVAGDPLLHRRVTRREYERLLDFAAEIGVTQGFYQEGETAKESFIPAFDNQGVLPEGTETTGNGGGMEN